jgi:uncharacterized protein (TIGR00255 family)
VTKKNSKKLMSMTGFASLKGKVGDCTFSLEIKSVNHRFCEVNVRLPGKYSAWDFLIQKEIKNRFQRGRFDVFIKEDTLFGAGKSELAAMKKLHTQLKKLCKELKLNEPMSIDTLLHYQSQMSRTDDVSNINKVWVGFLPLLNKLLDKIAVARLKEGEQIARWLKSCSPAMRKVIAVVERKSRLNPDEYRARLLKKLEKTGFCTDDLRERLCQELAILSDKIDITEELVRLDSHLKTFDVTVSKGGAVGRKLDFLMQELAREVNTITSKSQDATISECAIQLKTDVEKIREQAANVE